MQRERVGEVTENEKEEILKLHERKNALKELIITLNSPYLSEEEKKTLKEGVVEDLVKTNSLYESWWRDMGRKYNWESKENGQWMIDFQTKEIYFQA